MIINTVIEMSNIYKNILNECVMIVPIKGVPKSRTQYYDRTQIFPNELLNFYKTETKKKK